MDANILHALLENTAAINQLIGLIRAKETRSDWVDPEEAAVILGLTITKANNHRKQLNWLIRQGFLKQFRSGRPPVYFREELERVSKKIANGEIGYVGRA